MDKRFLKYFRTLQFAYFYYFYSRLFIISRFECEHKFTRFISFRLNISFLIDLEALSTGNIFKKRSCLVKKIFIEY